MPQKTVHGYTLPSGALIEIETVADQQTGASDVALTRGAPIPLATVIAPLGEVTTLLFDKIASCARAPDSITIEFAASLKGQTKLLIVSGEAEGTIKVTLGWKRSGSSTDAP